VEIPFDLFSFLPARAAAGRDPDPVPSDAQIGGSQIGKGADQGRRLEQRKKLDVISNCRGRQGPANQRRLASRVTRPVVERRVSTSCAVVRLIW
jgi:hypothetical protein